MHRFNRLFSVLVCLAGLLPFVGCSRGEESLTKTEKFPDGAVRSKTTYVVRDGKEILWGESIEYYQNGQIKVKCEYGNGKLHGKYETFYEDGRPQSSGAFAYGRRDGEWKNWDKDGKATVNHYDNGLDTAIPQSPKSPNP